MFIESEKAPLPEQYRNQRDLNVTVVKFQLALREVQYWNELKVQEETSKIINRLKKTSRETLQKLLQLVLSDTLVLAASGQTEAQDVTLQVPMVENFLHLVLGFVAHAVFCEPSLVQSKKYSKSLDNVIESSVDDAIAGYIPIDQVVLRRERVDVEPERDDGPSSANVSAPSRPPSPTQLVISSVEPVPVATDNTVQGPTLPLSIDSNGRAVVSVPVTVAETVIASTEPEVQSAPAAVHVAAPEVQSVPVPATTVAAPTPYRIPPRTGPSPLLQSILKKSQPPAPAASTTLEPLKMGDSDSEPFDNTEPDEKTTLLTVPRPNASGSKDSRDSRDSRDQADMSDDLDFEPEISSSSDSGSSSSSSSDDDRSRRRGRGRDRKKKKKHDRKRKKHRRAMTPDLFAEK
jgi:hypothetical protein